MSRRLPISIVVVLLCGCPGFNPHWPPWEEGPMQRMARMGRGELTDEEIEEIETSGDVKLLESYAEDIGRSRIRNAK